MKTVNPSWLIRFVAESNMIEGITREPLRDELDITRNTIELDALLPGHLERAAQIFTRENGALRDRFGMNVKIQKGNTIIHAPPPGGPTIPRLLLDMVDDINRMTGTPFKNHRSFETLHPFMDGNGRTGRLLWAFDMKKRGEAWHKLGFLHTWYYQSLAASR